MRQNPVFSARSLDKSFQLIGIVLSSQLQISLDIMLARIQMFVWT